MTGRGRRGLCTLVTLALVPNAMASAAEPAPASGGAASASAPADSAGEPARAARARTAFDQALRLAEALHDEEALLQLYSRKAMSPDASRATLESLVASSESRGVPSRAIAILDKRVREVSDGGISAEILAALLTRAGRAREAAAAWAKLVSIRGSKGLTGEEALGYARVLSRIDDAEQAWEVLSAAPPPATNARDYWAARGALAWQLSRDVDAERSYRASWQLGEHTPEVRQRLSTLARVHGDLPALASLAKLSFAETHDPAELIEAAAAQLDEKDWKGLAETLAVAERDAPRFAALPTYWTLRAEWLAHIGDKAGALDAWDHALAQNPESSLGAEYLWSVLGFRQRRDLARAVTQIRALGLEDGSEVREPLALALVELGRAKEALRLWSAEMADPKLLARSAYPLAAALAGTGRVEAAGRVRLRAEQRAISERGHLALETVEGRDRFVQVAEAIGALRGAETEVRWMRVVLATAPPSISEESRADLWARLRDVEGRTAAARTLWRRASTDGTLESDARERMLHLALLEDDRPFLRNALANPHGYPGDTLVEAALRVEDSTAAHERLANAPTPDDADHFAQVSALALFDERRATRLGAGATYETIGVVADYGPDVAGAFTWNDLRLGLDASARTLSTPSLPRGLVPGTREAEALVSWRSTSDGPSYSELAAGISYHSVGTLPRARALHERWFLGSRLLLSLRGALAERSDDAPVLRALATTSSASVTARFESGLLYATLAGKLRDDRTRRFLQLGTEISEEGEAGLRVWRGRPELDVGVRAYAQQRDNVRYFPSTIGENWSDPSLTPQNQLPPSFSFVALVARLAHGDLGARHALSGAPWPRYECGLETGWRLPARDWATGGQCTLGLRVGAEGEVSASALYGWGLFALSRASSARVSVTYSQRF